MLMSAGGVAQIADHLPGLLKGRSAMHNSTKFLRLNSEILLFCFFF